MRDHIFEYAWKTELSPFVPCPLALHEECPPIGEVKSTTSIDDIMSGILFILAIGGTLVVMIGALLETMRIL